MKHIHKSVTSLSLYTPSLCSYLSSFPLRMFSPSRHQLQLSSSQRWPYPHFSYECSLNSRQHFWLSSSPWQLPSHLSASLAVPLAVPLALPLQVCTNNQQSLPCAHTSHSSLPPLFCNAGVNRSLVQEICVAQIVPLVPRAPAYRKAVSSRFVQAGSIERWLRFSFNSPVTPC